MHKPTITPGGITILIDLSAGGEILPTEKDEAFHEALCTIADLTEGKVELKEWGGPYVNALWSVEFDITGLEFTTTGPNPPVDLNDVYQVLSTFVLNIWTRLMIDTTTGELNNLRQDIREYHDKQKTKP